jgi:hypothetical protein
VAPPHPPARGGGGGGVLSQAELIIVCISFIIGATKYLKSTARAPPCPRWPSNFFKERI